jgi:hypothetical protein
METQMNRLILLIVLMFVSLCPAIAQDKLSWGSLSGKVIDEKTKKPVVDAIILLKPAKGAFPIHRDDRKAKDLTIQIPPGRSFDFRTLCHYPYFLDGEKKVSTGQKLTLVGDAQQDHVFTFRAVPILATDQAESVKLKRLFKAGDPDAGTGSTAYIAAGSRYVPEFKYLAGYAVQSQTYRELKAHVFVFSHPYFAVSGKDGSFKIARVPAGAELYVWGWHEDIGYLLTKSGKAMTLKEGENTLNVLSKPAD